MKRTLVLFAVVALIAPLCFASYIVVTKDGTKYEAKAKWTIVNGKAQITLQNGQALSLNPADIDVAKSEQLTKLGLGRINVIDQGQTAQPAAPQQQPAPSLGSQIKLRQRPAQTMTEESVAQTTTRNEPPAAIADQLDIALKDKFERAYENIGIFEHKLTGTNRTVRVELIADNEDKVFNALSATAFLIVRNALLPNVQIDMVELFMSTTSGGAAGRFQMTRADAEAVNTKQLSLQDYFVRKVIY